MLRKQLRMTVVATGALVGALAAGPVLAEGNTSGPSVGSNVTPSTAMQKQHQAGTGIQQSSAGQQGSASGGAGIEAKPGTEGGASPDVPSQ